MFDILLLRKGPDSLPQSWFLFDVVLGVSILLSMAATVVIFPELAPQHILTLLLAAMTVGFYFLVLYLAGFSGRFAQAMSAIFGIDCLLTLIYLGGYLAVSAILDRPTALVLTLLLSYWSVPVQGHIISRAIQQHWGIGIGIALTLHLILMMTYRQISILS